MTNDRPNIIFIQTDQLSAQAVEDSASLTPNLNQLASEGVSFRNFYCNSPLCGPSRASMVTGQLPHKINAFDNASELLASTPTFMHILRRAGYEVLLSGKMHFVGPDQLHGFHRRFTTDVYPAGFGWTADWRRCPHPNHGSSVRYLKHSGVCDWGLQLDYDEDVLHHGLRCLRALARNQGEENNPFFLTLSFTHPHDPFHITPEYWERYRDTDVPPPKAPGRALEDMHPFNQWIQIHHEVDTYPPDEDTVQSARRAYFGMVSYIDDKVGEIVKEVTRLGLAENTVLIFTSDHGEMLGEHGMWYKRTFYDSAMRIPFIMRRLDEKYSGRTISTPCSLVDLFPTLVDLSGAGMDWSGSELLDGESLCKLCEATDNETNRAVIAEYYGEGVIQPLRMLCSDRWKYIYVNKCSPLLYDLKEDPYELNNLSGDRTVQKIEKSMKEALLKGWDPDKLLEEVMGDQQRRILVRDALEIGSQHSWDFQPFEDASRMFVRAGKSTQETKRMQRYPFVPTE